MLITSARNVGHAEYLMRRHPFGRWIVGGYLLTDLITKQLKDYKYARLEISLIRHPYGHVLVLPE